MKKTIPFWLLLLSCISSIAQGPTLNYSNGSITGTATRSYTVASSIANETPIVSNFSSPVYVKAVVTNMQNFRLSGGGAIGITQPGVLYPNGYQNYRFASGNGRVYSLDYGGLIDAYQTAGYGSRPNFPNMGTPYGIATVAAGDLVSDPSTHRIYLVTSAQSPLVVAGNPSNVQSGDQSGGSNAYVLMNAPMTILPVPGQRNKVWVADKGNNKIKILNVETQTTTDQIINGVTLNAPVGLATDPSGSYLYVTDANRLIKIDLANNNATVLAGAAAAGDVDGTVGTSRLNTPMGIAVDMDGNIFIADKMNHKIKIYVPSAAAIVTIAGNGVAGDVLGQDQTAQFNQPVSLTYDWGGNTLQVSDYGNNKIKTLTFTKAYNISPSLPSGLNFNKFTGVISGTPTLYSSLRSYTISLDNGAGTAQIVLPIQVLDIPPTNLNYSSSSNIFTVGNQIINLLPTNSGGVIASYTVYPSLPAGLSMSASTGIISGTPSEGTVQTDYVITGTNTGGTISSTVSIYVQGPPYNMGYSRAQAVLVQNEPAYLAALPMSYPAATSYSLNGNSPALPAGLTLNTTTGDITGTPTSLSANTTYIVDVTNAFGTASGTVEIQIQAKPTINYVQPSSPYLQGQAIAPLAPTLGGGSINAALGGWSNTGIQFGGNLAFIQYDNNNSSGPTRWVLDAGASLFKHAPGGSYPVALAGGTPSYLIMDPQYFFYNVSNAVEGTRITKSPASNPTRIIKQWGAGTSGYVDGVAHLARFNNIGQIATDAIGSRLFIPDRGNKRIRFLNVPTNMVSTIAGSGTAGTANGIGTAASFTDPVAVTLGADDNLYVLDQISAGNAKIRKVNLTTYEVTDFVSLDFTPSNYLVTDKGGDMYLTAGDATGLRRIARDGLVMLIANNEPLKSLAISPENGDVIVGPVAGAPMNSSFTNKGYFFTPGESITITPALFAGLSFDQTNGTITGTPTGAGLTASNNSQTYTVRATNRAGIFSTNVTLTVVRPPSGLTYQYAPWNILVGSNTSANTINNATLAVGGLPVETYSVSPALPAGLSLNTTTGQITGSALNLQASTAYTITASNAHGSTTAILYISVQDKPRPAYQGPQVYLKNNTITPLVPTNTGGAVLSPAEIRLSTLATLSNNNNDVFDIYDIVKDSQGNFYVGVEVNYGSSYLINKYDANGNELKSQQVPMKPYRMALDNDIIYFLGDYYDQYMYKMDISGNTWTPVITSLEHPGYNVQEQASKMLIKNNILYISNRYIGLLTYNLNTLLPENLFIDRENNNAPTNIWKGIWDNLNGERYDQSYNILQGGYVLNFSTDFDINSSGELALVGSIVHNPLSSYQFISDGIRILQYNNITHDYELNRSVIINNLNQLEDLVFHQDGSVIVSQGAGFYKTDNSSINVYAGNYDQANLQFIQGVQTGTIPMSQGQAGPISFKNANRFVLDQEGNIITFDGTSSNIQNLIQKYAERVAYRINPALPAGLQLDPATGEISGTPTAISSATNYSITAYNSVGNRSTTLNITVGAPINFTYQRNGNTGLTNMPWSGYVTNPLFSGSNYATTGSSGINLEISESSDRYGVFNANGVFFSINPTLPSGLTLNNTSGQITGTPTVARNLTTYTVTAVNAYGTSTSTLQFAITGPSNLTYGGNQNFINGIGASVSPQIGGITGTITYAVTSGALPAGVSLNTSTGVLSYNGSGAAVTASSVTITATGSTAGSASVTLNVGIGAAGSAPSSLVYNSTISLATGAAITSITPTINAGTAGAGNVTYTISPNLNALTGLSFNPATGVISGTPTALLPTTFTVTATTAYGSTSSSFSLQVGAVPSSLSYPNASYQFWRGDAIANIVPTITHGTGTTNFSALGLPVGLSIDPISGTIYGIPSTAQAAGTSTITASNNYGSATYNIAFAIIAPPTISYNNINTYTTSQSNITLTPTINGGYNNAVNLNVSASSFSTSTGLNFNISSGNITGTAISTALATTTFTATISSTLNGVNKTATSTFNITIGAVPSALSYSGPQLLSLNSRMSNLTPTITNGASVMYTASGLPTGVSIDPNTGVIYGIPTSNQSATNATITATNTYGSTQATVNFTVGQAPSNLSFAQQVVTLQTNNPISSTLPILGNNGSGNITYLISPGLPNGMSFNTATGEISGTPTVNSNNTYTITASNSYGSTSGLLQLAIGPPPQFSYNSYVLTAGVPVNNIIPTITTGLGTINFSVDPNAPLPGGLSIDPITGIISGTPTYGVGVPNTRYGVDGTNIYGGATVRVWIEVQGPPTNLNYGANIVQPINVPLSNTIIPTVIASPAVSTYSVTPALPVGLTFDPLTGSISGTPTVAQQATTYTFSADNWIAPSATYSLTITVSAEPIISYTSPQSYVVGTAISTLTPTVQNAVTSFSITPSLPAGLSFDTNTGSITGTPTTATVAANYTVTATNSFGSGTASIQITVDAPPSGLSYSLSTQNFTTGVAITSITPSITTGTGTVTYSVSPSLPIGLSINPINGVISGTPTAVVASANYTITATSMYGSTTAIINFATGNAPTGLSYSSPNTFIAGTTINAIAPILNVGTGSIVYTVSPNLPAGLTIHPNTGLISGTPIAGIAVPSATYTITATNSYGFVSSSIQIIVQGPPTNLIYPSSNLVFTMNMPITQVVPSIISNPAPVYSISPSLPAGLVFNTATGAITGTPTIGQLATTYTIIANNGLLPNAITTLSILVSSSPIISYTSPQSFTVGTAISALTPTVQNTVTSWSINPSLPAGLSFNTSTGVISGIPTISIAASNYTVTATNSFGFGIAVISLEIQGLPVVNFSNNNNTLIGLQPIQLPAPIIQSNPAPIFSISPNLPAGLSIHPTTGAINGTPTNYSASTTYTIRATNSLGTTSIPVILAILPPVSSITSSTDKLCGNTPLQLLNATANGVWSSLSPSAATVSPTGLVTGIGSTDASVIIAYTITIQGVSNATYDTLNYIAAPALPTRLPTVDLIKLEPTELQARPIAVKYNWTPANWLNNASIANPIVIANQEVEFKIEMTGSNGCKTVDTLTARMFDRSDIFLPNMFTPNGDGVNDQFKINPVGIHSLNYLRIFNQWGKMIFQTNRLSEGWDGYYDNQLQPLASYTWLLEAIDTKGKLIQKAGTVTLIR